MFKKKVPDRFFSIKTFSLTKQLYEKDFLVINIIKNLFRAFIFLVLFSFNIVLFCYQNLTKSVISGFMILINIYLARNDLSAPYYIFIFNLLWKFFKAVIFQCELFINIFSFFHLLYEYFLSLIEHIHKFIICFLWLITISFNYLLIYLYHIFGIFSFSVLIYYTCLNFLNWIDLYRKKQSWLYNAVNKVYLLITGSLFLIFDFIIFLFIPKNLNVQFSERLSHIQNDSLCDIEIITERLHESSISSMKDSAPIEKRVKFNRKIKIRRFHDSNDNFNSYLNITSENSSVYNNDAFLNEESYSNDDSFSIHGSFSNDCSLEDFPFISGKKHIKRIEYEIFEKFDSLEDATLRMGQLIDGFKFKIR